MNELDLGAHVGARVVVHLTRQRAVEGVLRGYDSFLNCVLEGASVRGVGAGAGAAAATRAGDAGPAAAADTDAMEAAETADTVVAEEVLAADVDAEAAADDADAKDPANADSPEATANISGALAGQESSTASASGSVMEPMTVDSETVESEPVAAEPVAAETVAAETSTGTSAAPDEPADPVGSSAANAAYIGTTIIRGVCIRSIEPVA